MGLFDTITIENQPKIQCPECTGFAASYQTKSLESALDDYVLDGKYLWMLERLGFNSEEEPCPEPRKRCTIGRDLPHGWVNIYADCPDCGRWIEFDLKFTDGVLMEIKNHGS